MTTRRTQPGRLLASWRTSSRAGERLGKCCGTGRSSPCSRPAFAMRRRRRSSWWPWASRSTTSPVANSTSACWDWPSSSRRRCWCCHRLGGGSLRSPPRWRHRCRRRGAVLARARRLCGHHPDPGLAHLRSRRPLRSCPGVRGPRDPVVAADGRPHRECCLGWLPSRRPPGRPRSSVAQCSVGSWWRGHRCSPMWSPPVSWAPASWR